MWKHAGFIEFYDSVALYTLLLVGPCKKEDPIGAQL